MSRQLPRNHLLVGDAVEQLRSLPPESVDCVVTSPPYFQLRNYGVENQLGLESHVDRWVEELRLVCRGLARVLKPSGSLWLNLGDSYSRAARYGAPAKGLLAAPERLLLALMADGWLVRNKVIWSKPNPMPSSVTDRLNVTYEVVYLLVRSPRYWFDLNAIREAHRSSGSKTARRMLGKTPDWAGPLAGSQDGLRRARPDGVPGHPLGKNPGDVWTIPTRGFRGAHFATFPEALIERPIRVSCPEAICTKCQRPWQREVSIRRDEAARPAGRDPFVMRMPHRWRTWRRVGELVPCGCQAPTVPGVVLDPFMGAGTVAVVAERLHRDWVGIELNPDYRQLAMQRIKAARAQELERAERPDLEAA